MCHLKALEKKGIITREPNMSRAIQMTDAGRDEGFPLVGLVAAGGLTEAIEQAERLTPTLVLLDVHLPGEDGFAVTERLAALAEPPAVVLISSRLIADLRQRVHDSAAVSFLAKHELTGAGLRAMVEQWEPWPPG